MKIIPRTKPFQFRSPPVLFILTSYASAQHFIDPDIRGSLSIVFVWDIDRLLGADNQHLPV